MIDALIQGKLIKAPESRTTKAGKPMASARLRVATADPAASVLCGVVAFEPEAVAALLALGEGDAVSVAGPLKVGTWTDKEGNARPSLDLVADRVLSVYAIRKQRAAAGGGYPPKLGHGDQPSYRGSLTEKPSHAAWQARQIEPPAHAFAGADDLDF